MKRYWLCLVLLLGACAPEELGPADDEGATTDSADVGTPSGEQQNDLRPPPFGSGSIMCPLGEHLYCPPVISCPPGTPPWHFDDCILLPQVPGQERNCYCTPD